MAAHTSALAGFHVDSIEPLFQLDLPNFVGISLDVSPDGKHFVVQTADLDAFLGILLSMLDASAMPLDFRHHRSIFAIRVQVFDSFAQSCVDGRIIGIPVSRVQQHTRHIPL